ncbi:Leucine-rich repeat transmembrane protein kinase [Theobroma cacao]|uniref:Leucine-rich repeat transmembrane protein kinase n=1 Tax=Theobroma cacao TaxID=3641 RepID=A0A061DJN9_THECC|nr:Leucine-rich repeat transmembrane protein kinase [Theobroma cacao]
MAQFHYASFTSVVICFPLFTVFPCVAPTFHLFLLICLHHTFEWAWRCGLGKRKMLHRCYLFLTALNISATLPPEFSKFRHLKLLDLSRNYFTGSIPQEWATTKLEVLSFMGSRLSGPFPKVFTYITSLRNLLDTSTSLNDLMKNNFNFLYSKLTTITFHLSRSIEGNNFSGPIPPDVGKLINLQKLILSSNAFNGELPPELAKLVNLTDMRVSDNNFSGKIPDIISNWKQIQKLQIQGCSPLAPIPSSISALTSLSDLRISDLKGRGFPFPPLGNMDSLKTLIKSNCQMRDTKELLNTRRNSSIKWGHEEIEDSLLVLCLCHRIITFSPKVSAHGVFVTHTLFFLILF